MSKPFLVLPRPGATTTATERSIIAAPSEASFTSTFGNLLPAAEHLQTKNGRIAYYSISPSQTSPNEKHSPISRVLFVHGVQTCAIGLQPLAKEVSARFPHAHCVLFDLWGHGLTDAPVVPYTTALFHSLIEALLNHLDWENAHFIGYSFGGSTTATFAAIKPERVSSMVLVAPAGLLKSENFSALQQSFIRGGEQPDDDASRGILEFLEGGELVVPEDWKERVEKGEVVAEAVRDWQMKNHEGHGASVVAVFRDGGVLDRHAEFRQAAKREIPWFSVLGELDEVCNEQDLKDVGMLETVVIPRVGHGVVRERAVEVAKYIDVFWKKIEHHKRAVE